MAMFSSLNVLSLSRTSGRLKYIFVAVAVVLGLISRFYGLSHYPGVNGDEIYEIVRLNEIISGTIPFTWASFKTPAGHPFSFLWFFLTWVFQYFDVMSYEYFRILPATISTLSIFVMSWFISQLWGRKAGLISLVWFAASPLLVIYSKINWEMALVPILSVAIIYFTLRSKWTLLGLFLAITFANHPTGILILSFLSLLILKSAMENFKGKRRIQIYSFLTGAVLCSIGVYYCYGNLLGLEKTLPSRLIDFNEFKLFIKEVMQLFWGEPALSSIAAPVPARVITLINTIFFTISLVFLGLTVWKGSNQLKWLWASLMVAILTQYLLGGALSLDAGHERWGLWLFSAGSVVLVRTILEFDFFPIVKWLKHLIPATLFCIVLLYFFTPLTKNGGEGAIMYRTAQIEPKLKTYQVIQQLAAQDHLSCYKVVADSWWSYYPLRFLFQQHQCIQVIFGQSLSLTELQSLAREHTYFAGFKEINLYKEKNDIFGDQKSIRTEIIQDGGGKTLIEIFWRPANKL